MKKLDRFIIITYVLLMATFAYAADGWQTTYSNNSSPDGADILMLQNISNTTDGADGTSEYSTVLQVMTYIVDDTAYDESTWNLSAHGATKGAIRDEFEGKASLGDNEVVTGFWSVAFQEVVTTSTDTLTAAECKGTLLNNYGMAAPTTTTLPAATKGLKFLAVHGAAAQTWHIKAGAGDKIYFDGTALDDADKVSNNAGSSAVGDMIMFFTFQTGAGAYDWQAQTIYGTFTDGGA